MRTRDPNTALVTASDKVSDVLARDESLVDVFVELAPHFAKLRNRAMRRVMARLMTVDQAARMASVPSDRLVGRLNAALGLSAPPASTAAASTKRANPTAHRPAWRVVELDVRDELRSGREPFSRIMAAVRELEPNSVLRVRAIFEPVPLAAALDKQGFCHESERRAEDDWSMWFWRPVGDGTPPTVRAHESTLEPAPPDGLHSTYIDVRGLEPPEPMLRTLAALESLPRDYTLVQVNSRVPHFLLPLLVERGFSYQVDDSDASRVLVRIWHTH